MPSIFTATDLKVKTMTLRQQQQQQQNYLIARFAIELQLYILIRSTVLLSLLPQLLPNFIHLIVREM